VAPAGCMPIPSAAPLISRAESEQRPQAAIFRTHHEGAASRWQAYFRRLLQDADARLE